MYLITNVLLTGFIIIVLYCMHVPKMRQTAGKSKFKPLYTIRTLSQTIFTGAEDYGIFFACIGTTCDPFTPPRTTRQGTSCLCTKTALHKLKHKVRFEDRCGSLSILTCNYNVLSRNTVGNFTLSQMSWLLLTKPTITQKSK